MAGDLPQRSISLEEAEREQWQAIFHTNINEAEAAKSAAIIVAAV